MQASSSGQRRNKIDGCLLRLGFVSALSIFSWIICTLWGQPKCFSFNEQWTHHHMMPSEFKPKNSAFWCSHGPLVGPRTLWRFIDMNDPWRFALAAKWRVNDYPWRSIANKCFKHSSHSPIHSFRLSRCFFKKKKTKADGDVSWLMLLISLIQQTNLTSLASLIIRCSYIRRPKRLNYSARKNSACCQGPSLCFLWVRASIRNWLNEQLIIEVEGYASGRAFAMSLRLPI
jgi:hypothetical protein